MRCLDTYCMTESCREGDCLDCSGGRYFVEVGAPGDMGFEECACECHWHGEE